MATPASTYLSERRLCITHKFYHAALRVNVLIFQHFHPISKKKKKSFARNSLIKMLNDGVREMLAKSMAMKLIPNQLIEHLQVIVFQFMMSASVRCPWPSAHRLYVLCDSRRHRRRRRRSRRRDTQSNLYLRQINICTKKNKQKHTHPALGMPASKYQIENWNSQHGERGRLGPVIIFIFSYMSCKVHLAHEYWILNLRCSALKFETQFLKRNGQKANFSHCTRKIANTKISTKRIFDLEIEAPVIVSNTFFVWFVRSVQA